VIKASAGIVTTIKRPSNFTNTVINRIRKSVKAELLMKTALIIITVLTTAAIKLINN